MLNARVFRYIIITLAVLFAVNSVDVGVAHAGRKKGKVRDARILEKTTNTEITKDTKDTKVARDNNIDTSSHKKKKILGGAWAINDTSKAVNRVKFVGFKFNSNSALDKQSSWSLLKSGNIKGLAQKKEIEGSGYVRLVGGMNVAALSKGGSMATSDTAVHPTGTSDPFGNFRGSENWFQNSNDTNVDDSGLGALFNGAIGYEITARICDKTNLRSYIAFEAGYQNGSLGSNAGMSRGGEMAVGNIVNGASSATDLVGLLDPVAFSSGVGSADIISEFQNEVDLDVEHVIHVSIKLGVGNYNIPIINKAGTMYGVFGMGILPSGGVGGKFDMESMHEAGDRMAVRGTTTDFHHYVDSGGLGKYYADMPDAALQDIYDFDISLSHSGGGVEVAPNIGMGQKIDIGRGFSGFLEVTVMPITRDGGTLTSSVSSSLLHHSVTAGGTGRDAYDPTKGPDAIVDGEANYTDISANITSSTIVTDIGDVTMVATTIKGGIQWNF